jgi:hypothetical protein
MLRTIRNIKNKLILFIALIFLISGFSVTEAKNSKDISNTEVQKKTISHKKKHSLKLVKSEDGHPVRSGKKSYRFEVKLGDCGKDSYYNDCKKDRQRTELQFKKYQKGKKDYWYSASVYLPNDYQSVAPVRTVFAQLYERGWKPILMITDRSGEWLEVGRMWSGEYIEMKRALKINDMKGKWTDILINARFSREEDGFIKVWINNKLIMNAENIKNVTPYTKKGVGLDFGIYQTFVSGWKREHGNTPYPSLVVYFDEVNLGTSKEKVVKNLGN